MRGRSRSKSSTLTAASVPRMGAGAERMYDFRTEGRRVQRCTGQQWAGTQKAGLALSGSDQAREGRLVDALAARGDEGRDTLR